jgi:hypothetical protein
LRGTRFKNSSQICEGLCRLFDLAQYQTVVEANKFFAAGYLLPAVGGPFVVKIILMIGAILMLSSSNATAQQRLAVGHCVADFKKLCPGVPPGIDNLRTCMREHIRDVSFPCLVTLAKFAEVRRFRQECGAHIQEQCGSVERGGNSSGLA